MLPEWSAAFRMEYGKSLFRDAAGVAQGVVPGHIPGLDDIAYVAGHGWAFIKVSGCQAAFNLAWMRSRVGTLTFLTSPIQDMALMTM